MTWELVPKPKKDPVLATERGLHSTATRVEAHRALVARHYPMTWMVAGSAVSLTLIVTAVMLVGTVVGPFMWIPFLAGLGNIFVAIGWPMTDHACTCPRCTPTDLR